MVFRAIHETYEVTTKRRDKTIALVYMEEI